MEWTHKDGGVFFWDGTGEHDAKITFARRPGQGQADREVVADRHRLPLVGDRLEAGGLIPEPEKINQENETHQPGYGKTQ